MKESIVQDILYICEGCGAENFDSSNIWKCQLCKKNEICQNCRIDIFTIDELISDRFAKQHIYTVCPECRDKIKQLIREFDSNILKFLKEYNNINVKKGDYAKRNMD